MNDHIVDKTTDIVYASSPVLTRLTTKNAEKFTGNSRIRRPVIVGELNGDFMARGEGVNIDFVTTDAALAVNMTVAWVNITLFGFDAMNDDGPEAVFNQVELKFLNASMKMAQILAVNMYLNGQGSKNQVPQRFSGMVRRWDELPYGRRPDQKPSQRHSERDGWRAQRLFRAVDQLHADCAQYGLWQRLLGFGSPGHHSGDSERLEPDLERHSAGPALHDQRQRSGGHRFSEPQI